MSGKRKTYDNLKPPEQIWLRWPGESESAFIAAKMYFSLDPPRTIKGAWQIWAKRKAAERGNPNKEITSAASSQLTGYSSKWHWVERAAAFDMERSRLESIEIQKNEQRRAKEWAQRYVTARNDDYDIAQALRGRAMEMLAAPLYEDTVIEVDPVTGNKVTVMRQPGRWRMSDVALYLKTASELQDIAFKAILPQTESSEPSETPQQVEAFDSQPVIIDVVRHPARELMPPVQSDGPRQVIDIDYHENIE